MDERRGFGVGGVGGGVERHGGSVREWRDPSPWLSASAAAAAAAAGRLLAGEGGGWRG